MKHQTGRDEAPLLVADGVDCMTLYLKGGGGNLQEE